MLFTCKDSDNIAVFVLIKRIMIKSIFLEFHWLQHIIKINLVVTWLLNTNATYLIKYNPARPFTLHITYIELYSIYKQNDFHFIKVTYTNLSESSCTQFTYILNYHAHLLIFFIKTLSIEDISIMSSKE